MLKRRVGVVVSALAIASVACQPGGGGGAASPTATGGGGAGCTVGVSWNNYQQERWAKADEPAIKKPIEAAGGKYIRTDAGDKEDQQITDIDSLINQGAKVLIVLAKDTVAILPAIEKAKAANIPVIGYDRLIEDDSVFYITFDNKKVGTLMAQEMLKAAPSGNYVIIKGHKADPNADFLRSGMTEAGIPEKGATGGATTVVFEEYTDTWRTEAAQDNMETALNLPEIKQGTTYDLAAVLSENDSMAIGVVAALESVGLAGTVPVSGQDGDATNLNNVAKGLQLVDVWKDAFALGETAGSAAVQLCGGAKLADLTAPSTLKEHVAPELGAKAQPFTTPGGKTVQSITLKPTPITKANLNLPIDLGWITKAAACDGAEADVAACQ